MDVYLDNRGVMEVSGVTCYSFIAICGVNRGAKKGNYFPALFETQRLINDKI